jgi:outer membrane protein assembly factor BamB
MKPLTASLALLALAIPAPAEWLHYRGPGQDGVAPEKLPAGLKELRPLWKKNVGIGTCSVVASGGRIFTIGNPDKKNDVLVCLEAATGKEIWKQSYPQALDPNLFEGGPRATPTLDGDRVYVVAQQGEVMCFDAATGRLRWKKHLVTDFGGKRPEWGYSGSPLVVDDLLITEAGGSNSSTVAFDKMTGALKWKAGSYACGYASPVVATLAGKRTLVLFKARHLVGQDIKNGGEFWRADWKTDYDINAATPQVFGQSIFISSGYGTGAAVFEVSAGGLTQKWKNRSLRAHVNTPVLHRGHVFGPDGNTGGGNLVCLDLANGEKKWEEKSIKGGSLIRAGDQLVVLSEKGELIVCDASPDGFKPALRTPVLDKRCWVQPTLSGGRLFVKNNDGDLVALDLK